MRARTSRGRVVGALSAALLAGGGVAWATVGDRGADAVPTPKGTPVAVSTGTPSAVAPSTATWPAGGAGTHGGSVTARDARPTVRPVVAPVRLQIAGIRLDLPVVAESVAADGQMALPPTPFEAGWYRWGPAPGDAQGASVIAAHIDTRADGVGPMAALGSLDPGAQVVVTSADGTRHTYRVTSVRSVAKTTLDLRALFDRTGAPRLHLVTCGGEYDRVARHYDDNVVVEAVPVTT